MHVGTLGDSCIERIDLVAQRFNHRKVAIDDGIQEGVQEIVGSERAKLPGALSESISDRVPAIPGAFLKRNQETFADEETDLFGLKRFDGVDHASYDEQIFAIGVQLGSLMNVDNIFQCQGVKVQDFTNWRMTSAPPKPVTSIQTFGHRPGTSEGRSAARPLRSP